MKCSWVKFQMERSEMSTSVVKWNEGLSKWVSIIIVSYIDHILLYRLSNFFHILLFLYCIVVYMVCVLYVNV